MDKSKRTNTASCSDRSSLNNGGQGSATSKHGQRVTLTVEQALQRIRREDDSLLKRLSEQG